jgi:hypothetical protein
MLVGARRNALNPGSNPRTGIVVTDGSFFFPIPHVGNSLRQPNYHTQFGTILPDVDSIMVSMIFNHLTVWGLGPADPINGPENLELMMMMKDAMNLTYSCYH